MASGIAHDRPARGAIFLKLNPTNPEDATHAGYCDSDEVPGGRFKTREQNSNENGSREGTDLVEIERPRHAGERYVFVYWWDVLV